MNSINWLHITDWHVGQSEQHCRWPNFRAEFERDFAALTKISGNLDLVFFTGDLVQSGVEEEFEFLEGHLVKLWRFFNEQGSNPQLVVVPGNHDLRRPAPSDPVALALLAWHEQPEVVKAFWDKKNPQLRDAVNAWFQPLQNWVQSSKIPMLKPSYSGPLYGDALYSYEKSGVKVGILGLNSTYLQFRTGNLEEKLALSPKQIPAVPETDYADFLSLHHIRVLMTHQPVHWMNKESKKDFDTDIWPPGRFDLHLCGHLHKAAPSLTSKGGSINRQTYQGTSFFGLNSQGEDHNLERVHGYMAGRWTLEKPIIKENTWPRIAHKKHSGALGLVPDPASDLGENQSVEREWTNSAVDYSSNELSSESLTKTTPTEITLNPLSEIAPTLDHSKFPRLKRTAEPQHWAIRSDERALLKNVLENNGMAFLVADWGMAKDDFLATCFGKIEPNDRSDVFILKCEAFGSVPELEVGFKHQFGAPLHDFLNITNRTSAKCLVFDGIQPVLTQGNNRDQFNRLCSVVRDFATNIKLLLIGRMPPSGGGAEITLKSLDTLETRTYVDAHPLKQDDLLSTEAIERLYYASGGLPTQIDRLLSRLQVASLAAVLDEESEIKASSDVEDNALLQCIKMIGVEDGSRTELLLRALTILPFGETIEGVKQFFPTIPLYPTQAQTLLGLALIEAIPVHQSASKVSANLQAQQSTGTSPKILRVPKQVRTCVLASMSVEERYQCLRAAAEFVFGKKWRGGGRIKLRKVPPEYRDYVSSGLGNEFSVVSAMLSHAVSVNNKDDIRAAVKLGLHYCGVLDATDRNRDLRMVSQDLIRQIEGWGFDSELAELHALCGRASRLTGDRQEAIKHFELSLESASKTTSKEITGHRLLEFATSLNASNDSERALKIVNDAQNLSKKGTLLSSQLAAKKANLNGGDEEYSSLVNIEKEARSRGWISHANDTAIQLASREGEHLAKISWLNKVMTSGERGWNEYRAVLEKAKLAEISHELKKLTIQDRLSLRMAYAFCHAQRLTAFDECHECLWELFEDEHNIPQLYALFRNSSFIWRLRGDDQIELNYYQRLVEFEKQTPRTVFASFRIEVEYFAKRAKILILRVVGL
jgi:hypothetical protein